LRTYALRDAWMSALTEALAAHPFYKPDWSVRHRDIDLRLHHLPHSSSLIEWWYFHAHLQVR
jgi:predicted secreted hydrolase